MATKKRKLKVYFSDYFNVPSSALSEYGAFNLSLINDLPVFIDPFLLFNSEKKEYQNLHNKIIEYITFLRERSEAGGIPKGLLEHWFYFPEVKQNWLGYSKRGNNGSGLGAKFAKALNSNFATIFNNFGSEEISTGSHLEKLCLIKDGVGRDNISDFTTNLIKGFLCEYTENFARSNIEKSRLKLVQVPHSYFDYKTRRWCSKQYLLPYIDGNYVLLTPRDILTKDDIWINQNDIIGDFDNIVSSMSNSSLRGQINDYFLRMLPDDPKAKEFTAAIAATLRKFPAIIDEYIKIKVSHGGDAVALSEEKLKEIETYFIEKVTALAEGLVGSGFYKVSGDTFDEAHKRVLYLKQVIENNDGYRIFYVNGQPIKREADLQLMFRLTWYASFDDVNSEVNNGRGPVDYKISRGSSDSTLVEFKLASNSKLRQNLEKQVEVYEAANNTKKSIKVILYFSESELVRVKNIMKSLKIKEGKNFILIDADKDNKVSGSNAK